MFEIKKAKRSQAKAKIALAGAAGSGKSLSALYLAMGLGEKIGAIDTENNSLSLYANECDFDVITLAPPYTPERYIEAIKQLEKSGYGTIIIDSASHEWIGKGGLLETHDAMPGNSYTNWVKITPRHQAFIDAIINSPCHIIATLRSKTEYMQIEDNGKKKIEKVGTAPQQRDGIDYEFTLCLDIQQKTHIASESKDRTRLWQGRYEAVTVDHGREIKEWFAAGSADKQPQTQQKQTHARYETEGEREARERAEGQKFTPRTFLCHKCFGAETHESGEQPKRCGGCGHQVMTEVRNGESVAEKREQLKKAAESEKAAAVIADECNKIRKGLQSLGCKTRDAMAVAIKHVIGRDVQGTTDLSADERASVLKEIARQQAEKAKEQKGAAA